MALKQTGANTLAVTTGKTTQEALNIAAGTTGLSIQDALNVLAGTTGRTAQDAANIYAGTTGLSIADALEQTGPRSISGLTLWLDAAQGTYSDGGTTPAVADGSIQQWNDQSGTGNHLTQGTAASRPLLKSSILNGRPSVRFDGTDDFLINSSLVASGTRTVFVALKAVSLSGAATKRFFAFNIATAGVFDSANEFAYYANQANAVQTLGGTVTDATVLTLSLASASSMTIYRNGNATTFDPADTVTSTNGFTLGAQNNLGSEYTNVDIFEVLHYNKTLSTDERNRIHRYLASKYGITIS